MRAPLVLLIGMIFPAALAADRTGWDAGIATTASHVETADASAVDAVELRVSVQRPRASLRIAVPWLRVDGDVILAGSGSSTGPVRHGGAAGSGAGNGAGAHGVAPAVAAGTTAPTETGIGDVRVQGRLLVTKGRSAGSLVARAGVKIPTADEARGLGTGKADAWAGFGWVRDGWTTDFELWGEWVVLGDSPDLPLEDGPTAGIALGWHAGRGRIWVGAEGSAEAIDGDGTRAVAFLETRWPAGGRVSWTLEAQAGLTDAAPDLGLAAGLTF